MNLKNVLLTSLCFILTIYTAGAQKRATILPKDLKNLTGCWQGKQEYSGTMIRKPFSTTADLVVKQLQKPGRFEFRNIYTKESSDNVCDTMTISINGRKLNNATVKSKRYTSSGNVIIVTEAQSFDHDNKKACIERKTYTIGKKIYTYKKEIKPEGEDEWMDRQENKYERKACGG